MDNNYHVFKNGELSRKNNTLLFTDDSGEKTHIPIEQAEAVYCHGQLEFNTRLAGLLNEKGVEIHIFGWNGEYSGSYVPRKQNTAGDTVVQQVKAYENNVHRRRIASSMVSASIKNMNENIKYYHNTKETDYSDEMKKVDTVLDRVHPSKDITELLGFEADSRSTYYNIYRNEIDVFDFDSRSYNPPSNEVNALISYLNSILYANCTSAIRKTALDPTISYVHEPGKRRYSLALDLADLFKPLLVDRIIIRLINRGQINQSSFRDEMNGCLLTEQARKVVTKELEKELEKTIEHQDLDRRVSYHYLLQLEAYALKKHLLTGEKYDPFVKWW